MRRRWRQTKDGFVEIPVAQTGHSSAPAYIPDIEPFKSPIDGSIINTRRQLEAHNRRHGVSNDLDSLREQTQKVLERQRKPVTDRKERISSLVTAFDKVQQGYKPNVETSFDPNQ